MSDRQTTQPAWRQQEKLNKKLQTIIFTQELNNATDKQQLAQILAEFEENYANRLLKYWQSYWHENGEAIALQQWNDKYKDYILGVEQEVKETTNEQQSLAPNEVQEIDSIEETAQHNATAWQELWLEHTEEVYAEQYYLFETLFYAYFTTLKESLLAAATETEHLVQENICELQQDISKELEQLKILGLPTTFGQQQSHKTNKTQKKSQTLKIIKADAKLQQLSYILSDDEADAVDAEEVPALLELIKNITAQTSASEEEEEAEMSTSSSTNALHDVQNKVIARRKKQKLNRKLRKVPTFIIEEPGLIKYWRKRFSLFSRFDDGIRLDRESWFSVTPEKIAKHLAKRLACDTIIDGFCGAGGNTIQFAQTCRHVIAIDIDPLKVEMAKHNASIYGVEHKIDFIVGDFLQLCETGTLCADAVFLSPPWGGPQYKRLKEYDMEKCLLPVGATQLMQTVRHITKNIAVYLPCNTMLEQIIKLAGVGQQCQVDHNYLENKLVAITALYGTIINNEATTDNAF